MENLQKKVIDIPVHTNGNNGHIEGHTNGNGYGHFNGNGHASNVGVTNGVYKNGHEYSGINGKSNENELITDLNPVLLDSTKVDDLNIENVEYEISSDGSEIKFKEKKFEFAVDQEKPILRNKIAKILFNAPVFLSRNISRFLESFIRYVLLSIPFSYIAHFVGDKNFSRSSFQQPSSLRNVNDIKKILEEFEVFRKKIEDGKVNEKDFFSTITQWAVDWTGLKHGFWWKYDPATSSIKSMFKKDNSSSDRDIVLDFNDKLFSSTPLGKIKMTREKYLSRKKNGKNNQGIMWRGFYEGKSYFIRDLENTPMDVPVSHLEKYLVSYFTMKSTVGVPIGFDEKKGYAHSFICLIDDKSISDNKDLFIKAYLVQGIADLASAMLLLIEFEEKTKSEKLELETHVKNIDIQIQKLKLSREEGGEQKIVDLQFELEQYKNILLNKDQVDFLNRTTIQNKINYELVQLMTKKLYEKNHEKNQVLDEKLVVEQQKAVIQKFQERINESNIAKFGKDIAREVLEQSIKAESVDVPFRNVDKVLQFIDLKNSTNYAEFLKNTFHFGLLIKAFHNAINSAALRNEGQLVNSQGDGAFHAYANEKKTVLSFITAKKNLKDVSGLLNFELFESINEEILNIDGQDYIKGLIRYLSNIYEKQIDVKRYAFQLETLDKIIKGKSSVELKDMGTIVYPLVKELSIKIFNDFCIEPNYKYKDLTPLFDFDLDVRMGIHQGKVTLGSIGSSSNLIDITMLGDAVNVTARVESANKSYGTNLLVTEQFMKNLLDMKTVRDVGKFKIKTKKDSVILMFREIDNVRFVGKGAPIKIYEIIF